MGTEALGQGRMGCVQERPYVQHPQQATPASPYMWCLEKFPISITE